MIRQIWPPTWSEARGRTDANYEVAIDDFDTVLRLDPRDVPALHWRGTAKLKKGDDVDGNTDLRPLIRNAPRTTSFMDVRCVKFQVYNAK